MKLEDIFKEIKFGASINKLLPMANHEEEIYTFKKEALRNGGIAKSKIYKDIVDIKMKEKYFLKPQDIIISVKRPFKVACVHKPRERLFASRNYIILRDINEDKYDYIFITYYLNLIGIDDYINKNNIKGDLGIEDVKKIEVPNISIIEQRKVSYLLKKINERMSLYDEIMSNDENIARQIITSLVGDKNV